MTEEKTILVSSRVPLRVHKAVMEEADKDRRSLSKQVVVLLEEAIKGRGKK